MPNSKNTLLLPGDRIAGGLAGDAVISHVRPLNLWIVECLSENGVYIYIYYIYNI